jgi:hypothetical protein
MNMLFNPKENYPAKITGYGINSTKAGLAQPYIQFELKDENESLQTVYWQGSLNAGTALEITTKTLLTAGFKGSDIGDLEKPNMFEDKELTIVVEEHTFNDKSRYRVKFVNEKKKKAFAGQLPSIRGELAKKRAEMGVKASKPTTEIDF